MKCRTLLVIAGFLILTIGPALGQDLEYKIKAGFIEKFTQFTDWPPSGEDSSIQQPFFEIVVLGNNPFDRYLDDIFRNTVVNGKQVRIRYVRKLNNGVVPNILFICRSEAQQLPEILEQVKNKPILTVSDAEGFGEQGVMLNFFTEQDYIRFEINYSALMASELKISSRVLKLARILNWPGETP